jgi:hypothetical protein
MTLDQAGMAVNGPLVLAYDFEKIVWYTQCQREPGYATPRVGVAAGAKTK